MKHRAFSLLEVLVVVAGIGTLASIAYVTMGDLVGKSRDQKLASDTETLNRAVKVYLASGGSLDNVKSPAAVLKKLKSKVSTAAAARMPGVSGQVIDPRVSFEESEDGTGIIWDSTRKRFVPGSGKEAIKGFILDESIAEVTPDEDDRGTALKYAANSSWIWDFQEAANPSGSYGPTLIPVSSPPAVPVPATPVTTKPPTPPTPPTPTTPAGVLDPPVYSIPGGSYLINSYDLMVSLTNPNPSAVSKLVYSTDFGPWLDYTSPLSVTPGSTISAQTVSLDPNWDPSAKVDQFYDAKSQRLAPPVILPSKDGFGLFIKSNIQVDLANPNQPDTSTLRYRLDRGPWMTFTDKFLLKSKDYPSGVVVEAQAISAGSPYYLDSTTASRLLPVRSLDLSGNVTGSFHDPTGQSGMLTNLSPGESNSFFEWGDGVGHGLSESTLDFTGGSFSNLSSGERFQIGALNYYNGTILADTGADTIEFGVGLTLDINGNIFNPYFDFSFDLVNVRNNNDPNNPWADADYVYLDDARASQTLIINDTEFEFRIEFGETTADGFASVDEFYVLEEESAFANLYGTFVELGPVTATASDEIIDIAASTNPAPATGLAAIFAPPPPPSGNSIAYQKEGYVDPEEGAEDAVDEIKELQKVAKNAREDAEGAAKDAEKLLEETKDKYDENDLPGAREKADEATYEAIDARTAADIAEDAAVKAKEQASVANSYALKDPAAEKKAQEAIDEAVKTIDEYQLARDANVRANDAAKNANLLVDQLETVGKIDN